VTAALTNRCGARWFCDRIRNKTYSEVWSNCAMTTMSCQFTYTQHTANEFVYSLH